MNDQLRINTAGELESDQPRTWDNEPLYSPSTVQEGLFASEAFKQMPGQTAMETDSRTEGLILKYCACCRQDFWTDAVDPEPYCCRCNGARA
jgi:hypothetical protein